MSDDDLPPLSYAKHPPDGRTVVIVRNEMGFHDIMPHDATADLDADRLNVAAGVTKAQAAAMLAGSMFGWDVPAAKPASYNDEGQFITRLPPGTAHGLKADTIGDLIYRQHGGGKS